MTQEIEANKTSVDMSDSSVAEGLSRRGHFAFNWSDIEEITLPNGVISQMYRVGLPDDDSSRVILDGSRENL